MSIPQIISNRFEVGAKLGEGGMGAVYRGTDRNTGQIVAIKSLKADVVALEPGLVERFVREGEALSQLNHPNIVKMLSAEQTPNGHFLVMEYVSGGSLRDLLDKQPRLPVKQAASIALDLADALTRAHRLNIIHRDIKPANVLIAEDGTPRLTDFGVARVGDAPRMTQSGSFVGTLMYISPETLNGDMPDERADIWAFGAMIYEMLAGRNPFDEGVLSATLAAIMTKRVPDLEAVRPDVPVALVDLVYRMLHKDPHQRIPSVRLVGAELEALLRGRDTSSSGTKPPSASSEPPQRSVFQTTPPRTPDEAKKVRHNLPAQTTPFVGRDAELEAVARLLNDPNTRLVTIVAPGGMGKTRLALEVAQRMLDATDSPLHVWGGAGGGVSFDKGVFFAPLAPLTSPEFIPTAIAEAISFTFYGADEPKHQLLNYLREKHVLLVMDNFEHVVAGATLVADILQAAPDVKVLATSRERLNLHGESLVQIGGMEFPDYETPQDIEDFAAVKLFLQSAHRVQPDFVLTDADRPYLARITRLVQGMPLGIELAAAWVEMLPLHEIAKEIESSLDFLETELRDVPERHRSMRAVFEYSWNLLSADERDIFSSLSVFRGGFTREAAQAVAGAGLRPLTALVNKSLLRRDPAGRYEVHELLRQYAEERLTDVDGVQDRHSSHYLEFLSKRGRDILSREQKKALDDVEVELQNIRSACWYAVEHSNLEGLNTIIEPLNLTFETLSLYQEGIYHFKNAVEALVQKGVDPNHPSLWRLRLRYGWMAGRLGDYETNETLARQSLDFFRQQDSPSEMLIALNNLCYVAMMQGRYAESQAYGEEAMSLTQHIGGGYEVFMTAGNLGYLAFLSGEYQHAREIYEVAMEKVDAVGIPIGMAFARNNLGEILHALDEDIEAKRLFEEGLALFKTVGNRRGMAFALNNLGNVAHAASNYEEAQNDYQQSLDIYRDIGDRSGIANALNALGGTVWWFGEYESAKKYHSEALTIFREIGDARGIGNSLVLLGLGVEALGDYTASETYLQECWALRQRLGNVWEVADILGHLCRAATWRGDYPAAERYNQDLFALASQVSNPGAILGQYKSNQAQMLYTMGNYEAAKQIGEELLPMLGDNAPRWLRVIALQMAGLIKLGLGELTGAWRDLRQSLQMAEEIRALTWEMPALYGLGGVLGKQGQMPIAVEILVMVRQHRATGHWHKMQTEKLLGEFQSQLPPDSFAAAVERGKARDLDATAHELLAE